MPPRSKARPEALGFPAFGRNYGPIIRILQSENEISAIPDLEIGWFNSCVSILLFYVKPGM